MALDKTLIFIAHRLTIAERTEKVVVLNQGKIVEEGTPADLLAQDGFMPIWSIARKRRRWNQNF